MYLVGVRLSLNKTAMEGDSTMAKCLQDTYPSPCLSQPMSVFQPRRITAFGRVNGAVKSTVVNPELRYPCVLLYGKNVADDTVKDEFHSGTPFGLGRGWARAMCAAKRRLSSLRSH